MYFSARNVTQHRNSYYMYCTCDVDVDSRNIQNLEDFLQLILLAIRNHLRHNYRICFLIYLLFCCHSIYFFCINSDLSIKRTLYNCVGDCYGESSCIFAAIALLLLSSVGLLSEFFSGFRKTRSHNGQTALFVQRFCVGTDSTGGAQMFRCCSLAFACQPCAAMIER